MPSDAKHTALKLIGFEYYPIDDSEYLFHNASKQLVGFRSNIVNKWVPFTQPILPLPALTNQAIEILNGTD